MRINHFVEVHFYLPTFSVDLYPLKEIPGWQKSEKNTTLNYLFLFKLEKLHSTEMLDSKTYN